MPNEWHSLFVIIAHKSLIHSCKLMCGSAEGRTRTGTSLRTLRPERSASTNSTTSAGILPVCEAESQGEKNGPRRGGSQRHRYNQVHSIPTFRRFRWLRCDFKVSESRWNIEPLITLPPVCPAKTPTKTKPSLRGTSAPDTTTKYSRRGRWALCLPAPRSRH